MESEDSLSSSAISEKKNMPIQCKMEMESGLILKYSHLEEKPTMGLIDYERCKIIKNLRDMITFDGTSSAEDYLVTLSEFHRHSSQIVLVQHLPELHHDGCCTRITFKKNRFRSSKNT